MSDSASVGCPFSSVTAGVARAERAAVDNVAGINQQAAGEAAELTAQEQAAARVRDYIEQYPGPARVARS